MKVAFIFTWGGTLPPDKDNIKAYFVSKQLLSRGHKVFWLGGSRANFVSGTQDRIQLNRLNHVKLPFAKDVQFLAWAIIRIIRQRVDCIYADCWFFCYGQYHLMIPFQILCKLLRVSFVNDLRDPYVEHEVASGRLVKGSIRELYLRIMATLSYKLADLLIVPSEEYREYFSSIKNKSEIFSAYRGVDTSRFNPKVRGDDVREALGLNNKFVIGWFGIMRAYRRISEIIIPLIQRTRNLIPEAYFLIGGDGPLKNEFFRLKEKEPDAPFRYVGLIPYDHLPSYIASCDVILCPVSTEHEHGRYSLWLKYSESLAIGRPVLGTRTPACTSYFGKKRGVIFVKDDLEGFVEGLLKVYANYSHYRENALEDAADSNDFAISSSSGKIVERILTGSKRRLRLVHD